MLQNAPPVELNLAPSAEPVTRLRIRFLTPTELKSGQELAGRPEHGTSHWPNCSLPFPLSHERQNRSSIWIRSCVKAW
jgi:hypothetical protein